jgi:H(+)-translocating pyrophosphatase
MHNSIANGAYTYISTEYKYLSWFLLIFGIFIYFTIDQYVTGKLLHMPWLTVAFLLGALASLAAGFTGISIAVMANIRVTISVCKSLEEGFLICFKSAASVAFLLLSIAVSTLASLVAVYKYFIIKDTTSSSNYLMLYDNIAGFALGAAMAALFGRVGGGIYTKAADIGADLTSTEHEMEEDDPKNPATIADIVGDNVGDVAGMGSELFACFAQSTCAVMLVAAAIPDISKNESILSLPLIIASLGIAVAIISTIFASYVMNIDHESDVERVLKYQLTICSILMTAAIYIGCDIYIPNKFVLGNGFEVTKNGVYACMIVGLWAGYTISYITEYCTSNANDPVKEVVKSCETGAATNIIYGVALGYGATVIPIVTIAFTIYTSYILGEMYGIAMSSVGMLSTVCISFTLNAFGPISDNAKGLMTVCKLDDVEGKERALTLVSAGNSMGASSMGFSLGVAALSALSMFGAVISRAKLNVVDILHPLEFAGLIIGAMISICNLTEEVRSCSEALRYRSFYSIDQLI